MIRINNIKIKENLEEEEIFKIVLKKEKLDKNDIKQISIHKKSIDARKKDDIHYNYSVNIILKDKNKENKYVKVKETEGIFININKNEKNNKRPIIIGTGPAGMFAALTFIKYGIKPIIIEQGKKVDDRVKDINKFIETRHLNEISNIQFGEGGAGTFSDGKLNTGGNNPYIKHVLEMFVKFGAPKEILYDSKPHIGTDILVKVVKKIRGYIIAKGGEFLFEEKVIDFKIEENKIKSVVTSKGNEYITDNLILAIGNSARDTFKKIYEKGVNLKAKEFAVGLRIEHLQSKINKSQYGENLKFKLPNAEYKLVKHLSNNRVCYSFCMCPGGEVVAATSKENMVVVNGMSKYARNETNSNSAIVINITTKDFDSSNPLNGIKFQEELEHKAYILGGSNYSAPIQRVEDFLLNRKTEKLGEVKPSYKPDTTLSNLNEIFPKFINDSLKEGLLQMEKSIKGFSDNDAVLTGVETRTSSPIQITRDKESLMSNIEGLYPCGEGAGYAGGIMTSAIDGIKCALKIIEK